MHVSLNDPAAQPYDQIERLAFLIGRPREFVHAGLVYRTETGQLRMSHMAWHHFFLGADDPNRFGMFWIDAAFNPIVCDNISDFLEHVDSQNRAGLIPYSIRYAGQQLDKSGKYIPKSADDGLSCTTYLVDVFEVCNVPLIAIDTWPEDRPDDFVWGEEIINALRRSEHPISSEYIAAQERALVNLVRFRPQELAAAFGRYTMLNEYRKGPAEFGEIEPESIYIRAQIP